MLLQICKTQMRYKMLGAARYSC